MSLQAVNPTQTQAWKKLQEHFKNGKHHAVKQLFEEDALRAQKFHINWQDFIVDYSKNRITSETLELLLQLAEEVHLKDAIQKYFSGEAINKTENRAVLHTALRASENSSVFVNDTNVIPEIFNVKNKIQTFSEAVISDKLTGYTGKPFALCCSAPFLKRSRRVFSACCFCSAVTGPAAFPSRSNSRFAIRERLQVARRCGMHPHRQTK